MRKTRQWVTARGVDAAVRGMPLLAPASVDRIAGDLARLGRHAPIIARQVAENMRALGLYSAQTHAAYFAALGRHFAGAMHALRYAECPESSEGGSSGKGTAREQWHTFAGETPALPVAAGLRAGRLAGGTPTPPGTPTPLSSAPTGALHPDFATLLAQRVALHGSARILQREAAGRRGVIVVGPHVCNYLLYLARLNAEIPLTIYLRHSKHARRRELKERWYRAAGVQWISEPADAGGSLGRVGRMAAALNEGRVLFITPDLPQKREDGTPVRFFNREIYLPAGPALLAVRTGAPVLFLTAEPLPGGRQCVHIDGPCTLPRAGRGRAARREAVQRHLQWFAAHFERFLRRFPAEWYLWGDKRWTRVLHNDARYVRRLPYRPAPVPADTPDAETSGADMPEANAVTCGGTAGVD